MKRQPSFLRIILHRYKARLALPLSFVFLVASERFVVMLSNPAVPNIFINAVESGICWSKVFALGKMLHLSEV